jgi:NAD(P)-binding Rossmann-like domain
MTADHVIAEASQHPNGIVGTASTKTAYPPATVHLEDRFIDEPRPLRVAVIGAGLAGVTAAILLPAKVQNIDIVVFEKNDDVVRNPKFSLTSLFLTD